MSIRLPLAWFYICGEVDDKPKEYFEKTKKEVSHKNPLAKRVHQHKMQNVDMSDDERKVDQEYQRFKRKQNRVSSICEKKIQETQGNKITCP